MFNIRVLSVQRKHTVQCQIKCATEGWKKCGRLHDRIIGIVRFGFNIRFVVTFSPKAWHLFMHANGMRIGNIFAQPEETSNA